MSEWIPHDGGCNPIPHERFADVRLRDGTEFMNAAIDKHGTWQHVWGDSDIIAYRLETPNEDQ